MTVDIVRRAFEWLFASQRCSSTLEIAWHGGEPLVVPIKWYQQAFALIADMRPFDIHIQHRFQTNGLLLDDAWADFLGQTAAKVGLSIDGPSSIHDRHRRRRNGTGTHKDAMSAVRVLQDHKVPFHVITVLTAQSLKDPDALFDFYVDNGIKEVGFNIDEIEGANHISSLASPLAEADFRLFLRRFLERVWEAPNLLTLRELEGALEALGSTGQVVDEQNTPFAVVSVGYDGQMSTFSPELLGTRHYRFANFSFAHLGHRAFYEMGSSFQSIAAEIEDGIKACKASCAYFRWCGGGAPANKLFETGRFDSTTTLHCRLSRQVVLDETLASLAKAH